MTGKELTALRAKLGLSQYDFADKIGVSHITIHTWEHFKLEIVPFKYVQRILTEFLYKLKNPVGKNQPKSKVYGFSYPAEMMLKPLTEKQCAKLKDATVTQHQKETTAIPVFKGSTVKRTLSAMPITYSETMPSVGDISSQCLLNTGSASYKKLVTWLEKV